MIVWVIGHNSIICHHTGDYFVWFTIYVIFNYYSDFDIENVNDIINIYVSIIPMNRRKETVLN